MLRAICVSCGHAKHRPFERCKGCGFAPTGDDAALARSVYLSVERLDDSSEQARLSEELAVMQEDIRAGRTIEFEPAELERLAKQLRLVRTIPAAAPWNALLRLFGPGVLILAVLGGAVWFVRRLNSESDAAVRRAECTVQLAHMAPAVETLPAVCLTLPLSELEHVRSDARCFSLRQRAKSAGQNPDDACIVQVVPAKPH
jgi:hypothetical protein